MMAAAADVSGGSGGGDVLKWNLFLLHHNVEHSNYKLAWK